MAEPYTYGYQAPSGTRGRLLFARLDDALYTSLLDLDRQRRTPLGIRQGAAVLVSAHALTVLHAEYRARLAQADHWPLCQALAARFGEG